MKQEAEEIIEAMVQLCKKYELRNVAICGTHTDGRFLGVLGCDKLALTADDKTSTILNVGRLWQFARETIKNLLNQMEKP